MKRLLCSALVLAAALGLRADQPSTAAPARNNNAVILAAQAETARATDEKFKIMAQDIETLNQRNQQLEKRINELIDEINKVREEHAKSMSSLNQGSIRQDVKTLGEKIVEVDRKREADKQAVLVEVHRSTAKTDAAIERLGRDLSATPAPRATATPHASTKVKEPPKEPSTPTATGKGILYTVKPGETLKTIVRDFNAEHKSDGLKPLTQKMVMQANPKVNWAKLPKNQQIKIPIPPKE